MTNNQQHLSDIINHFLVSGDILSIEPYGNGHINRTYLVTTSNNAYILQRINNYVFKDVDILMNNIYLVSNHVRDKGNESLEIIPTKDNKLYYRVEDDCYRLYIFVKHTVSYEKPINNELISKLGKGFASLHLALKDIDAHSIKEVISNFHNTPIRYGNLIDAISKAKEEDIANAQEEIRLASELSKDIYRIQNGLKEGKINLTVIHNDPKINNILFDETTNDIRCIIDLDTVMPGTVLFDIGDSFRSLFTGDNEDSTDLSKLVVNYDIFKTYVKAYLSVAKKILTKDEISLIPYSAFLLTYECSIRFLEDYLRGNKYFAVKYETHNLVRARSQLTLANNIYQHLDHLSQIVNELLFED